MATRRCLRTKLNRKHTPNESSFFPPNVFGVVVKDREWHDMKFEGETKIKASFWAVINEHDERER